MTATIRTYVGRTIGAALVVVGVSQPVLAANIPSDVSFGTWDGSTYTLTTDLTEAIVIDRDGFTLDGANHTVTGSGSGNGVTLNGRSGVTVKDLDVQGFSIGIYLANSSDNAITGSTVSGSSYAIYLLGDTGGNTIEGNILSGNGYAIYAGKSTGVGNSYVDNDLSRSTAFSLWIASDAQFAVSGNDFTDSANGILLMKMDGASLSGADVDLSTIQGGTGVHRIVSGGNNLISDITASGIGEPATGYGCGGWPTVLDTKACFVPCRRSLQPVRRPA